MTDPVKAVHPVKVDGKRIAPGGDIDPQKVGEKRLARLIEKGRATAPGEAAPVNRAIQKGGRPDVKLPGKAKGGDA